MRFVSIKVLALRQRNGIPPYLEILDILVRHDPRNDVRLRLLKGEPKAFIKNKRVSGELAAGGT